VACRPAFRVGPAVDKKQFETDLHYIEIAKTEATLALGGHRLDSGDLAKGFFVAPTIFTGVKRDMRIAQEEVFGPSCA